MSPGFLLSVVVFNDLWWCTVMCMLCANKYSSVYADGLWLFTMLYTDELWFCAILYADGLWFYCWTVVVCWWFNLMMYCMWWLLTNTVCWYRLWLWAMLYADGVAVRYCTCCILMYCGCAAILYAEGLWLFAVCWWNVVGLLLYRDGLCGCGQWFMMIYWGCVQRMYALLDWLCAMLYADELWLFCYAVYWQMECGCVQYMFYDDVLWFCTK